MNKSLLFVLALLSSTASFAADRGPVMGTFNGTQPDGRGCYLKIELVREKIDLTFTDEQGWRTLWNVGRELDAQLARGTSELVFDHNRQSLGDATIHLVITRDSAGKPTSFRGTVDGWLHAKADCTLRP